MIETKEASNSEQGQIRDFQAGPEAADILKGLNQLAGTVVDRHRIRGAQELEDARKFRDRLRALEATDVVQALMKVMAEEKKVGPVYESIAPGDTIWGDFMVCREPWEILLSERRGVYRWKDPDKGGDFEKHGKNQFGLVLTPKGFRIKCEEFSAYKICDPVLKESYIVAPEREPGGLLDFKSPRVINLKQLTLILRAGLTFEEVTRTLRSEIKKRVGSTRHTEDLDAE